MNMYTVRRTGPPRFALSLGSNLGLLVLLVLPWIHISCDGHDITVRGAEIALGSLTPEAAEFLKIEKPAGVSWHAVFILLPAANAILCLCGLLTGIGKPATAGCGEYDPRRTIVLFVVLLSLGLAYARMYLHVEVMESVQTATSALSRAHLIRAEQVESVWLWPYWLSFFGDGLSLAGTTSRRLPPAEE